MTVPKILIDMECKYLINTENPFFIAEILTHVEPNQYSLKNLLYYTPSDNNVAQHILQNALMDSLAYLREVLCKSK
jgi:hypothetical protein